MNIKTKVKFDNEKDIYSFWEKNKFFSADPTSDRKPFSLLIPPPNLTGELHLGHAMQHSILDAVARFKRLQGFDVLLLPGVDHAGIQFEATLDKKLSYEGLSKQKLGREKWLEEAWKFKGEIYKSVSGSWRMMGLSADWGREVFTLDDGPKKAVFEEFKKFWEKGLIYKGPYIVLWCPKDNTAIEDVEMEYEERKEKLYYVKYQRDKGTKGQSGREYIVVATTRPETIFADTAIAVYPNHPVYKNFVGSNVFNPLTGEKIPVIEDKRVEKDFGTGALKVTPGHDFLDYEIGKTHSLAIRQAVNKDGRMTDLAGEFEGQKVLEAREKVAEKLKAENKIEKVEEYTHNVAVCERCKSVVEPLISEEWFVKMDGLAKEAIGVLKAEKIKFLPTNYKKILIDWLENIHDWCISRSLWWGHRIPVWYRDSAKGKVISDKSEIKVSLESPGPGWVQDEQVLDTWFSSGLWPMSTLGWPTSGVWTSDIGNLTKSYLKSEIRNPKSVRYFPWDFEISAPEIKYLWIARMIMLSKYFANNIPFKTMFFHGMLRDLQGRKFSKSLGNGIEPQYLIDNWGVDATRMALYTYSIPGRDGRVSKQSMDERGKNFRNFGTKLRNIARYVLELKETEASAHPRGEQSKNSEPASPAKRGEHPGGDSGISDDRILDELEKTTKLVTKHLENLELHLAVDALYEFIWHEFADRFIETSKHRRVDTQPTLEHVLKHVLILLHPFMPFLTEELYQKFDTKRVSIMLEEWPTASNAK